jgi:hypothetical protein
MQRASPNRRIARWTSFALTLCLTWAATAGWTASEDRVLFIGNSLTAWNSLPLLVEAMGQAKGVKLRCESVTYSDVSLEDHWSRKTQKVIQGGGFKHVVLQQGPSSLIESRTNLRKWTKEFAQEIRAVGAVPALLMVWPDRSRRAFFPHVRDSYRLASDDVQGIFIPAGEAWEAAWRRDSSLDLYGPDNFHPSPLGTYAAAAAVFTGLTGLSPHGLPARLALRSGDVYKVDERKAALVLEAVAEVSAR